MSATTSVSASIAPAFPAGAISCGPLHCAEALLSLFRAERRAKGKWLCATGHKACSLRLRPDALLAEKQVAALQKGRTLPRIPPVREPLTHTVSSISTSDTTQSRHDARESASEPRHPASSGLLPVTRRSLAEFGAKKKPLVPVTLQGNMAQKLLPLLLKGNSSSTAKLRISQKCASERHT